MKKCLFLDVCPTTSTRPDLDAVSAAFENVSLRSEIAAAEGTNPGRPKARKKCSNKQIVLDCAPSGPVEETNTGPATAVSRKKRGNQIVLECAPAGRGGDVESVSSSKMSNQRYVAAASQSETATAEGTNPGRPKATTRKKCSNKQIVFDCAPSGPAKEMKSGRKQRGNQIVLECAPACRSEDVESVSSSKMTNQRYVAAASQSSSSSAKADDLRPPLDTDVGLSLEVMYGGALKTCGRFFVIDDGRIIAVAGWDHGKCQLRVDEYFIINGLVFLDDGRNEVTILACTCDASQDQCQQLRRLDSTIPLQTRTISELRNRYCIHRSIVEFLGLRIEGSTDDDANDPDIEQHISEPDLLWSVKIRGSCGIVQRSRQGHFNCLTCKKRRCDHVLTFEREHKNFEIELPAIANSYEQQLVLSQEKISIHDGYLCQFSYPVAGKLAPFCTCEHGVLWKGADTEQEEFCVIYDVVGVPYKGSVIKSRKSGGHCSCTFDGHDRGVINVNNKDLVEYSLLSHYMSFFGRGGMTLAAFHDSISQLNRDMKRDVIPYNIMYRSWMGFTQLMQLDETSGFCCRLCGVSPEIILLDGTALSCRKDLIPKEKQQEQVVVSTRTLDGLPIHKRVFIGRQKTRKLLMQFATGEVYGKKKEMAMDDVEEMVSLLESDFPNSPLHRLVVRLVENGRTVAPDCYRLFLRELSKNTPVVAMFQLGQNFENRRLADSLRAIIDGEVDISDGRCIETMAIINSGCPAVLEFLFPIRRDEDGLPADVRGVVGMLLDKLENLVNSAQRLTREMDDYCDVGSVDTSLEFFPCWPVIRGRAKYDADTERIARDESDTCCKYSHGLKVLGPGIVVYLCRHGVCYGFGVMRSYESPKMPFEVFMSRYVPSTVVYDNACKLHLYALKREPMLFMQTRFFVDKFHWYNHKACSIGYDLRRYKTDRDLVALNSQAHEQLNSSLKQLRRSLSYMKYSNFFRHLKLFLYLNNRRKNSNV